METNSAFQTEYDRLNPEQRQAVDTIDGPVMVVAGPGTGKTQILTLRIANILRTTDIEPENILALTFTNTAAYNMRERLSGFIGSELAHRVTIATFHSFCEQMIKRNTDFFPDFFGARLISDIERIQLLEEVLAATPTKYFSVFKRRGSTMGSLLSAIDKIKNEGLTADEFAEQVMIQFDQAMQDEDIFYKVSRGNYQKGDIKPAEQRKHERTRDKNLELGKIYEAYQSALRDKGLYDFSDVIIFFIQGMREQSDFQAEMQEQFQYILVDEHQDTNDAQNTIIGLLIDNEVHEGRPNIFFVGDGKQAIYRFAGASEQSFNRFKELLRDTVVIDLVNSYRSGQHVLDSAHGLISGASQHQEATELSAFFKEHHGVIEYRQFSNYKMELLWLAQDLVNRQEAGEDLSEIAVLFRNNRDANDIRLLLGARGLPYQDLTKKNILEDVDIIKIFLLFRAIYDLSADDVLARLLYVDFLGLDVVSIQKILRDLRYSRTKSLFDLLVENKDFQKLSTFLQEAKTKSENENFLEFFSFVIRESGFLGYLLAQDNSVFALAKLEKLFDEVKKEFYARDGFGFAEFIQYLDALKKYNIRMNVSPARNAGVQLMTFHGAKGLEFDTVYIVRTLDKRKVPTEIKLPFGDFVSGETDDERRLMYVALTRARKNVLLSSYIENEEGKEKTRSQFIDQIPGLTVVDTESFAESQEGSVLAQFLAPSTSPLQKITDQEHIVSRFLESKLSVSALNNYIENPILYFFRNLMMLPEARSPFLDLGNLVHGTLERYFVQCREERQILGLAELEAACDHVVAENPAYRDYYEHGLDILRGYFVERQASFELPLETEFRVPALPFELPGGESIKLTGVIDKITRDENGDIVVWDYKTGKSWSDMPKDRREKLIRQAAFYRLLLRQAYGGKYNFHKVVFDFIEPSEKTGEYERQEIEIEREHVDQVIAEINQLAEDIFSGNILQHTPEINEKTAAYMEILATMQGPIVQEQLFNQ